MTFLLDSSVVCLPFLKPEFTPTTSLWFLPPCFPFDVISNFFKYRFWNPSLVFWGLFFFQWWTSRRENCNKWTCLCLHHFGGVVWCLVFWLDYSMVWPISVRFVGEPQNTTPCHIFLVRLYSVTVCRDLAQNSVIGCHLSVSLRRFHGNVNFRPVPSQGIWYRCKLAWN